MENEKTKARSLSPVSDNEVEVLAELAPAEKRSQFQRERRKRVEAFKADLKSMTEALEKQRTVWIEEPETHLDYESEWKKFWSRKSAELRARGLDVNTFDLTPEWTIVWKNYFEADFATRIAKEREILMRKHKLLTRDLADANPQAGQLSPNGSAISSSSSLSDLDQNRRGKRDQCGTVAKSASLGGAPQSGSHPEKREERCSSPWEEEEDKLPSARTGPMEKVCVSIRP